MGKIEELKVDDSDDGFETDSNLSSHSAGVLSGSESEKNELIQVEALEGEHDMEDEEALETLMRLQDIENETIADRIFALRDIIPPATRDSIAERCRSICRITSSTFKTLGSCAWVVTTSMILVGLPLALSIEGESMLIAHEKEVERHQSGQQHVLGAPVSSLTPGTSSLDPSRTAVTPTGF